jgi:hypothetical protein
MLTTLRGQLNQFAHLLQAGFFPAIEVGNREISETARQLIATLAMLPLHRFVPAAQGWNAARLRIASPPPCLSSESRLQLSHHSRPD